MSSNEKKRPTGDYEVGYCRPPEHTRWKKGQCPNKNGRCKKPRPMTLTERFREQLQQKVTAREGEKEITISVLDLVIRKLTNDLLTATGNHRLKLFLALRDFGAMDIDPELMKPDRAAMNKFLEQLAEEARRSDELEQQFPGRSWAQNR